MPTMLLPVRWATHFAVCLPLFFFALTALATDLEEISVVLLERTVVTLDLGEAVYLDAPDPTGYDEFFVYQNRKDRAIVAKLDNICYAVFRESTFGGGDWAQNLVLGRKPVCNADAGCCLVRRGFWKAWNNDFRVQLEEDLRGCVDRTCPDTLDCVVLGGSSQGGAIATVAAMDLSDLNPWVLTTGLPNTIVFGCSERIFDKSKYVRFINSRVGIDDNGNNQVIYDTVPMVPGIGLTRHYGHPILLNEEGGIAGLGFNTLARFRPIDPTFDTHWIRTYRRNLQRVLDAHVSVETVSLAGYSNGTACSRGIECESGTCQSDADNGERPLYCTSFPADSPTISMSAAPTPSEGTGTFSPSLFPTEASVVPSYMGY